MFFFLLLSQGRLFFNYNLLHAHTITHISSTTTLLLQPCAAPSAQIWEPGNISVLCAHMALKLFSLLMLQLVCLNMLTYPFKQKSLSWFLCIYSLLFSSLTNNVFLLVLAKADWILFFVHGIIHSKIYRLFFFAQNSPSDGLLPSECCKTCTWIFKTLVKTNASAVIKRMHN